MILSFHPCFVADQNRICAGRDPDAGDLEAIRAAEAVVLPQGCRRQLYEMARRHCAQVWPDYDARFTWPDKIGQIALFRHCRAAYPQTEPFDNLKSFYDRYGNPPEGLPRAFPLVFKFAWGGEGDTVFFVESPAAFRQILQRAAECEKTGQTGFILQEYIACGGRSLRVAVVGETCRSYWRIQNETDRFHTSLARGARIDAAADAHLQEKGVSAVRSVCRQTGINLAGFDLVFSGAQDAGEDGGEPLFLEINYFFGRKGLGGSEAYYRLLGSEIEKWLETLFPGRRTGACR